MRSFRDNWLKMQPEGPAEIAEYYATAPEIVRAIDMRSDASSIWENLYHQLVLPCVQWIQNGEMEQAHEKYRDTARKLAATYLHG